MSCLRHSIILIFIGSNNIENLQVLIRTKYSTDGKHLHTNSHYYVFTVKQRYGLKQPAWKDELYKYITGIIQNNQHRIIRCQTIFPHSLFYMS
jgi:hypothetical protein